MMSRLKCLRHVYVVKGGVERKEMIRLKDLIKLGTSFTKEHALQTLFIEWINIYN